MKIRHGSALLPAVLAGTLLACAWAGAATPATPAPGRSLSAAAYKDIASKWGTEAGIEFRYGKPSTRADAGLPSYHYRGDGIQFTAEQEPQVGIDGYRGNWQVGGPARVDSGDYFQNMANALFVATDPSKSTGSWIFQQIAVSRNAFSQRPEISRMFPPPWHVEDAHFSEMKINNPIAMGRCNGRPGWCLNALVAFQNGTIANAIGSNNALNRSKLQLEAGMVPTAVTVTNSSEFALVSVWDTNRQRGRVAVIALTGLCNGCDLSSATSVPYWDEWRDAYPGLPSLGNIGYMKLLGYVELPDMQEPTEIAASTGWSPTDGRTSPGRDQLTLSNEANRKTFMDGGGHVNSYARTGVAVVISKSQRKATFIDLRPLFAYYKKMYFGSPADFAKTKPVGDAANQWPFTFGTAAEQMPKVIKTIAMDQPPTAVKTSLWGANPRAWIATEEGRLRLYSLGNYLSASATGHPAEIVESGSVAVGANPTAIAYYRAEEGDIINSRLIVVSRGERKVQWIDLSPRGGTVSRTLQDRNLRDPISADDNGTHNTSVAVLTVADYAKGVSNYRYANLIMNSSYTACQAPAGCPTIGGPFEYGGTLVMPGKVFAVSGTNVP